MAELKLLAKTKETLKGLGGGKKRTRKASELIFYTCIVSLPFLQFLLFYLYVNFDTFVMSFQQYDYTSNKFYGFSLSNYKEVFTSVASESGVLRYALKNTLLIWSFQILVGFPISMFVSFYIYKKMPCSKVLINIMMIPSMLSSLVTALIFKYMADRLVPHIYSLFTGEKIIGLLANYDTVYWTLMIWTMWGSLTNYLLLAYGTMNGINESLVEATALDGASYLKEFIHVTLPCIYPTIVVWLTESVAGFFTLQIGQFPLFGSSASSDLYTFGYYTYIKLLSRNYGDFAFLSAMGVLMTLIAMPITLLFKRALEKYGPSAD